MKINQFIGDYNYIIVNIPKRQELKDNYIANTLKTFIKNKILEYFKILFDSFLKNFFTCIHKK